MAENTKGRHLLTEKDFVDVVDAEGNSLPSVPKHWGAEQLPAGAETKTRSKSSTRSTSSSSSSQSTGDQEPAGNASRDAWADYAVKVKGAKSEDLVDGDGNELGRDELKAKFGTPAES